MNTKHTAFLALAATVLTMPLLAFADIGYGGGGGGGGNGAPVGLIGNPGQPGQPGNPGNSNGHSNAPSNPPAGLVNNPGRPGQVLGASTYNFTVNLKESSRGADVTALQQILIDAGLLNIPTPTGFFGPSTKAAVIAWQNAHKITPASGFVGPLTRVELNKGNLPTMSDERASLIASLETQLQTLLAKIRSLMQASTTASSTVTH